MFGASRNPEIIQCVVKVAGRCDIDEIKTRYQELVEKCERNGSSLYPRLRMCTKRVWREIAFVETNFAIEEQVKLGPKTFNSTPLTEDNIEKCLILMGREPLPLNVPPWEVIVSPIPNEDLFYMLIRIHRLILEEQKNLNVREMTNRLRGKRILSQTFFNVGNQQESLLIELKKSSTNMLTLFNGFVEFLSDQWNNFVLEHDSLEHYDGFCRRPEDLLSLISSIVITLYNTHREYKLKLQRGSSGAKVLSDVFSVECEKRELNRKSIQDILISSMNPINASLEFIRIVWWLLAMIITLSPFYVLREVEAIRTFMLFGSEAPTDCLTGFTLKYAPIVLKASKEFLEISKFLLNMPRLMVEDKHFRSKIIRTDNEYQ